jgi:glycosyltransferase involved in cell wall biosynthesis
VGIVLAIVKKKIIIAANSIFNLVNHRVGLINGLLNEGYEVITLSPTDAFASRLKELDCQHVSLQMDRKGTNIGRDLMLFWRYRRLLKKHMPDVYLGFTVKPNIYGSLAAQSLGIPVINNISGLGTVFGAMRTSIVGNLLSRLLQILYRFALSRSDKIFFQNKDDRHEFIEHGVVKSHLTDLLPGSGVDLDRFVYTPIIATDTSSKGNYDKKKTRFLLIARMLWDKGVGKYVEAARLLSQSYPNAEFCLLGFLDFQNPEAISEAQVNEWIAEGIVNYLGVIDDIRPEIVKADCVVLPVLFREGTPRSLLEAAAMGRPIITTNSIGCRETVDDGVNGYLCIPGDSIDLSKKMEHILLLDNAQRDEMGRSGREKMELQFDEQIVIQKYFEAIKECI